MHKQHPVAAGGGSIYRKQKMGFVLIHIAYFSKTTGCVTLFPLHFNKFSKTLLTIFTYRGIFLVNPTELVGATPLHLASQDRSAA